MTLAEQLTDYVHAAFSGLWIVTHEPDEAEREIATLARERQWKLAAWDIARGLRFPNAPQSAATDVGDVFGNIWDFIREALQKLSDFLGSFGGS